MYDYLTATYSYLSRNALSNDT
ncbi:hypothetical protein MTBPR1_10602 [Candidatus Terasakiella magnetica]|uniref:Uncharacterized protein n=1 Tax=Candidatus Terasakiella magnetica TaxID=1867952 RepID=A0A1C3RDL9_9PROT|nr:hypothetical protein MTBPR1_10602 [Candidatus Terasakiella magnetica]